VHGLHLLQPLLQADDARPRRIAPLPPAAAGSSLAETPGVRIVAGLVIALAALLPGCGIDCFDGAELEAAYRAGEALAAEANRAAYDRGRADGLALTRADGERDGDADGYATGYADGYEGPFGYAGGWNEGYVYGNDAGLSDPSACSTGAADGHAAGASAGHSDAWDAGWTDGWNVGYSDGWYAGNSTCAGKPAARTSAAPATADDDPPDPDDLRACKAYGYDDAVDPAAYSRGFEDGKRANPEYQAGYQAAFTAAYQRGVPDGEADGWFDGYTDGYASGFAEGYDVAYLSCWDQAWQYGYDEGFAGGWDSGWSSGYSDGYSEGYDDGMTCSGSK
jgi:hypothetical protein